MTRPAISVSFVIETRNVPRKFEPATDSAARDMEPYSASVVIHQTASVSWR
jgi:hypothetical protein